MKTSKILEIDSVMHMIRLMTDSAGNPYVQVLIHNKNRKPIPSDSIKIQAFSQGKDIEYIPYNPNTLIQVTKWGCITAFAYFYVKSRIKVNIDTVKIISGMKTHAFALV